VVLYSVTGSCGLIVWRVWHWLAVSLAVCDMIKPGVNRNCAGWLPIVFALADEIGGIVFAAHCRFG